MKATFVHVNLIARDWKALAKFYESVFGVVKIPPERDFQRKDLDAGTGLSNARLRGAHYLLPGHKNNGPTLEIFSYDQLEPRLPAVANRPGFGHIAFEVEDVPAARKEVLAAGGKPVGQIVTLTTATGARVTWCYVTDPEGNMIELQSWQTSQ
jgi:predicted enzyme related to lactoylglutathione lyase